MNNLKQLVISEAYALREHATQEERENLNFDNLDPFWGDACVYGQMTGMCISERAVGLLLVCAQPYSARVREYEFPSKEFVVSETSRGRSYSPIEFYIGQKDAQNATLIQFLRGERDSLTIQDL